MSDFVESSSTDKLAVIGTIVDNLLNKIPKEKITEIKKLSISWDESEDGETMLPCLDIKFHKQKHKKEQ